MSFLEHITVVSFAASYGVALGLEIGHWFSPRPIHRFLSIGFGAAGLLAHTIFMVVMLLDLGDGTGRRALSLSQPVGSLLFLAWILAWFYLYGSIHHHRLAWGLFVLPLVLGLVALAELAPPGLPRPGGAWQDIGGERFWGVVHGLLVLLAAVGISVGFVASLMYLVQVHRLRAKLPPGQGLKIPSLERIEVMNRRAILWSFPLLTAGLIVGVTLQLQRGVFLQGWDSAKIIGTFGLWLVFAIMLYLRYRAHARGRQMALLTMLAFVLLLMVLIAEHGGGGS